jgi:hypothetical protein
LGDNRKYDLWINVPKVGRGSGRFPPFQRTIYSFGRGGIQKPELLFQRKYIIIPFLAEGGE